MPTIQFVCASNINNLAFNILSTPQNHFKINGSNEKNAQFS